MEVVPAIETYLKNSRPGYDKPCGNLAVLNECAEIDGLSGEMHAARWGLQEGIRFGKSFPRGTKNARNACTALLPDKKSAKPRHPADKIRATPA